MRTTIALSIALVVIMVGGSACVNVGTGTSPPTRFFLLDARSKPCSAADQESRMTDIAIGIGPVVLPHYLDRPQILTRVAELQLSADEFNLWAEPLKTTIPRVMGENLSAITGSPHIRMFPWHRSTRVDLQVVIGIQRFDADADGRIILKAAWQVMADDGQRLLIERQSTIEQTSTGSGVNARVQGMSMALSDLASEIAGDLFDQRHAQKKNQASG